MVLCSVLAAMAASAKEDTVQLEEIVVTGSRLESPTSETASPVVVFDRARIEQLGVSNVPDLLKHLSQQPYKRDEGFDSTGAQYAQLRGLGVDSTLVLINGRRVVPSAANVSFNGFNLNSIPLSAVERVEVLSDAGSAVYGADAMGGVVNILLTQHAPALALDASYGSADGGAQERHASLSTGYDGEHLNALFVADYFDRGSLLGEARERYANQDFRRYGGEDWRATTANPGNVYSVDGGNLPGLDSGQAAVPAGRSGQQLTPQDFLADQINLVSLNRYTSAVPQSQRRSALGRIDYTVSPRWSLFGEGLYVDQRTVFEFNPAALAGEMVPASNAFNPFGSDVLVDTLLTGLGSRRDITESELWRAVAGVRGTVGRWRWEVAGVSSDETASAWLENDADFSHVAAALASNDPAQALNVFEDGPGGSEALLQSLKAAPVTDRYESQDRQVSAFVRGPLATLAGHELQAVLGGEWRRESMREDDVFSIDADREVTAAYAELRAPVWTRTVDGSTWEALTLTAAGRMDDYSDFGQTFNAQYGITWRPVRDWLLRASYGTSFRAPSLFELYAPRRLRPLRVIDPARGNEITETTSMSGGNPALDPIEGDTTSGGFVFTPASLAGLRLSATYWRIEMSRRVAAFSPSLLLQYEDDYPLRVTRAPATSADVAAGLPGRITLIDVTRINYGRLDTRGVDVDLSYAMHSASGEWTPRLAVTWVDRYRTIDLPGIPARERVGIASTLGSIARWRIAASLGWQREVVGASIAARYTPAYRDADPFTGISNGRTIDAQCLVDVQGTVDLGAWGDDAGVWRRGLTLAAGVDNVFNEAPPFAAIGFDSGYDPSQGELRQRFAYVRIGKRF